MMKKKQLILKLIIDKFLMRNMFLNILLIGLHYNFLHFFVVVIK